MNQEDREIEIDLLQLGRALWEKAIYILLVAVIFGLLGFAGSKMFVTPVYQASAKMIVNNRKDDTQYVTNDQLNSAKSLVDTYAIIIRSRNVLNQVIAELELPETYGQLYSRVSVQAVNNTQVMKITVQHTDVSTAFAITEKILDIAPNMIMNAVEAGSVKTVEQAYASSAPVSPSAQRNAILMAMVGFALACAVVVIKFLTDNTYKTDLDVQHDFDLPVLGVIPTLESCGARSKYSYGYGYGRSAKKRG